MNPLSDLILAVRRYYLQRLLWAMEQHNAYLSPDYLQWSLDLLDVEAAIARRAAACVGTAIMFVIVLIEMMVSK